MQTNYHQTWSAAQSIQQTPKWANRRRHSRWMRKWMDLAPSSEQLRIPRLSSRTFWYWGVMLPLGFCEISSTTFRLNQYERRSHRKNIFLGFWQQTKLLEIFVYVITIHCAVHEYFHNEDMCVVQTYYSYYSRHTSPIAIQVNVFHKIFINVPNALDDFEDQSEYKGTRWCRCCPFISIHFV